MGVYREDQRLIDKTMDNNHSAMSKTAVVSLLDVIVIVSKTPREIHKIERGFSGDAARV